MEMSINKITYDHMDILLQVQLSLLPKTIVAKLDYDRDDMLDYFTKFFTPEQFERLFILPEGKGYLIGLYTAIYALKSYVPIY